MKYSLIDNNPQEQMKLLAAGAAQPKLGLYKVKQVEIPYPPLPTQRKIAAVLSAYDDLIENNTRRIAILEEMAQTLYREWFVHFRFPGHESVSLVESDLGPVPEGWEVVKAKDIVKRFKAGKVYREKTVKSSGSIPVIDQSRDDVLGYHNNDADHLASPENPIIIFGDHTCKMQLMIQPFSIGPNVVPFAAKVDIPILYLYFVVQNLVETREYKRHWTELMSKEIVVAGEECSNKFSENVTPMFEQIDLLKNKNTTLRQTRDLLLPRLISGEVDVSALGINLGKD